MRTMWHSPAAGSRPGPEGGLSEHGLQHFGSGEEPWLPLQIALSEYQVSCLSLVECSLRPFRSDSLDNRLMGAACSYQQDAMF